MSASRWIWMAMQYLWIIFRSKYVEPSLLDIWHHLRQCKLTFSPKIVQNLAIHPGWLDRKAVYNHLEFTIEEILLVSNYLQMNYHPETLKSKKVCPEQVLPLEYLPCNRSCPQRSRRCTPWCWESLIRCLRNVAKVCLGNSSGSTWRRTDVISSLLCPCKCFRKRLCDWAQTSVTGNLVKKCSLRSFTTFCLASKMTTRSFGSD